MHYQIVTVSQLERGFIREGCQYFLARLEKCTMVEVIALKEGHGGGGFWRS